MCCEKQSAVNATIRRYNARCSWSERKPPEGGFQSHPEGGEGLQLGHWSTDFFLSHPVGGEELQLGHWSTDFFLSHPVGGEGLQLGH
tara:strand:+ start:461 stop:721 length:261 start_codon:yes stop_codon:yes gene_type:complete